MRADMRADLLLEDLDERPLAAAGRDRIDDRPDRAGRLARLSDHLAEIVLGDLELVHAGGALLDEGHPHFVPAVDEVDREVPDQLADVELRHDQALAGAAAAARFWRRTRLATVSDALAPVFSQ